MALLIFISFFQPLFISIFPSQIAMICRHPNLEQYDLSSVVVVMTMGSGIYPKYETEIFHKLPNMLLLNVVIHFSVSGVLLRP